MKYGGIGSRRAPLNILALIRGLAAELKPHAECHTGGALGCDKAFIDGTQMAGGFAELWLPWQYYNGYVTDYPEVEDRHINFTKKYHPAWHKCSEKAQIMHARNSQIVLGDDLDDPVDFIVCWTPDGKLEGGTAQALRIAIDYDIPVFNLGRGPSPEKVLYELKTFLEEYANISLQLDFI